MFLLPSLAFGLVFALVLGGKLSRLADVRFRLSWTVPVALAVQVVIFSSDAGHQLTDGTRNALHLATYFLLTLFACANFRIRSLWLFLIGLSMNTLAIAANGGKMPISAEAARAVGVTAGSHSNVSVDAPHLRFLGDVFALPVQFPLANVFSIGDLFIGTGMALFIVLVATSDGRERSLDPARLVEPLRTRNYRLLAVGKLVSHAGDWLTLAALVGWIYDTTGSTGQAALLLLSRLAPPVIGGGIAALVVDRLPKARLLAWIEGLRGAAVAAALLGIVGGQRPVVFAALACSGALAAISNAAVSALLPSILPRDSLASANAGLGIAKDAAMAAGALGAGLLLRWVGVHMALLADLGTFAVALTLFACLRVPRLHQGSDESPVEGRTGALRYVFSRRWLLALVFSFAAATLATGLTNATLPAFLEQQLALGPGGYGFGIGALAVGLAAGQALIGFARIGTSAGRWMGAALTIMAALLATFGLTVHAGTALLLLAMIGFLDGTTDVLFETTVQRRADPRHLGAVFGFSYAFITTTMMSAIAVAPLINRVLSPRDALLGASVFLVVAGVIAAVGMRESRAAAPAGRSAEALAAQETHALPVARYRYIRRLGSDVTLVAYGGTEEIAQEAASKLATEGVSVEVLDLGLEPPWVAAEILESVSKTSRALVLHPNSGSEVLAAEIAATIADRGFRHLKAPVRRVYVGDDVLLPLRELASY